MLVLLLLLLEDCFAELRIADDEGFLHFDVFGVACRGGLYFHLLLGLEVLFRVQVYSGMGSLRLLGTF